MPNGVVIIDLVDEAGRVPERSGLNWGHRPERERNPNEAYIRVPAHVAHLEFFPPRGKRFVIETDDGETFDAVVAQDSDKAIETPDDNSLLGAYFRRRLGLASGAKITRGDLDRYGRINVRFEKIGDGRYVMDFST